ncbi:MAG: LURP-one-related family protein [Clostridia bacterium]|nr:LURP-one-related family protein [Clostridia bacterium]
MYMHFKQRFFSWFDSYDIYGENDEVLYTVEGQLSWGHCLKVFDAYGRHVAMLKEQVFTFLPKFDIYIGDEYVGFIKKEFTFFKPSFTMDYKGWSMDGDWLEWDYTIRDSLGAEIAAVSKNLFRWTDDYTICVHDPQNALHALMAVLAVDVQKCSRE